MIAAIPSIDPVEGAPIIGCYCYRTYPDVEFHPGIDLSAYPEPKLSASMPTAAAKKVDLFHFMKVRKLS